MKDFLTNICSHSSLLGFKKNSIIESQISNEILDNHKLALNYVRQKSQTVYRKPISLGHKKKRKSILIDQTPKLFDSIVTSKDLNQESMSGLDDELLSNKFDDNNSK